MKDKPLHLDFPKCAACMPGLALLLLIGCSDSESPQVTSTPSATQSNADRSSPGVVPENKSPVVAAPNESATNNAAAPAAPTVDKKQAETKAESAAPNVSTEASAKKESKEPAQQAAKGPEKPKEENPKENPASPPKQGKRTEAEIIAEMAKFEGHVVRGKPPENALKIWYKGPKSTDDGLVFVKEFPEVKWLQILYINRVTDAGLAHLSGLKHLERLDIDGANVGDAGLAHLKDLTTLKTLTLSFNNISDAGLVHLEGMKALQLLALDDTQVTEKGVAKLKQVLPKCKILTNVAANRIGESTSSDSAGDVQSDPHLDVPKGSDADWPQWRGPNRDGLCAATGLLQEWPAEGPPLLWEIRGIGRGHSAVAIQGQQLFVTGSKNGEFVLTAVDPDAGKQLRQVSLIKDKSFRSLGTATIDDKFVYVVGHEGDLFDVNTEDGSIAWHKSYVKDFGGDYQCRGSGGGFSESVLIDGDVLVCTPGAKDAAMVGLNKQTGETLWKAVYPADVGKQGTDTAGFSSPIISNACGVRQYVQLSGRGLISVAAENGRTLWAYNRIANDMYNISTPIIRDDYVFASTANAGDANAGSALLQIVREGDELKAREIYRLEKRLASNHHGGMVLLGDSLYMGHGYNRGFPLCLDFKTGKVAWRTGRGPGMGSAAVLYADQRLYFRYEDGVMALLEPNPKGYVVKGKFTTEPEEGQQWAHPVIARGCLYLRGNDWLRCYNLKKG